MSRFLLVQGKTVKIDDEDFPLLNRYKWFISSEGYARTCFGDNYVYMHRLIMAPPTSLYVDHRNNNRLDNRKSNLRIVTNSKNQQNRKIKKSATPGVSWHRIAKKWRSRITVNTKEIHLGLFDTKEDAIKARKQSEVYYEWN